MLISPAERGFVPLDGAESYLFNSGDIGEVFNAVAWFAMTGCGWYDGCWLWGIGLGYAVRFAVNGDVIAVPNGAKPAGVNGSACKIIESVVKRGRFILRLSGCMKRWVLKLERCLTVLSWSLLWRRTNFILNWYRLNDHTTQMHHSCCYTTGSDLGEMTWQSCWYNIDPI